MLEENVLGCLIAHKGEYISGEVLSGKLGVTRAAVWKDIRKLRAEGYGIEAARNKGYRLVYSPDLLTYAEVSEGLVTAYMGRKMYHFDSIGSTNDKARELARSGAPEGTVVTAEQQQNGRGRMGRLWFSPSGKGIYATVILRPSLEPSRVQVITQVVAAAIGTALLSFGIEAKIKWPNDILLDGRKICGILTELSGELGRTYYVTVGFGINVNESGNDIPQELSDFATSIKMSAGIEIPRKKLLCAILNNFEDYYDDFIQTGSAERSIAFCRKYSAVLGKRVDILKDGRHIHACANEIGDDGELIVSLENGGRQAFVSGEVTVRSIADPYTSTNN